MSIKIMPNQLNSNQWNWGAFLLCPLWCIRYQIWIGMISIFPIALISLMSLILLGSFYLLVLILTAKSRSLLSGIILVLLFFLICIPGSIFLWIGKNTTMVILVFFYIITSAIMGYEGDKLVLKKINKEQDIQKFNVEKYIWLSSGLLFSIPLNMLIFYLTEKSVSILIDVAQLPGI